MVLYKEDKDTKLTIITCECGCGQEFHIRKDKFRFENPEPGETVEYEISSHSGNWYTEQDGIFSIIKKRIKRAWSALRGKDYLYQDVCLTEEQFDEFINELNKIKNN